MTTAQTISYSQIRSLRDEAATAGDDMQYLVCEIALEGSFEMDDYVVELSGSQRSRLAAMTQDEAIEACAAVIAESEAMVD